MSQPEYPAQMIVHAGQGEYNYDIQVTVLIQNPNDIDYINYLLNLQMSPANQPNQNTYQQTTDQSCVQRYQFDYKLKTLTIVLLQKLPLQIHIIFQRLLSKVEQTQKKACQSFEILTYFCDVVKQLLTKQVKPFQFLRQLLKIFEEFFNVREQNKNNQTQFQQMLVMLKNIKEKTDKTELEIKDILQRLHKIVLLPKNTQEQPHNLFEQISNILKHHLINSQHQNNQEVSKQQQQIQVQKWQQKLLNTEVKSQNLQDFYDYIFAELLKMLQYSLKNLTGKFNLEIVQISQQDKEFNEPFIQDTFKQGKEK
ncbi:hypothetical protein ABPG72_003886 [Tetrahymena utriculariae]